MERSREDWAVIGNNVRFYREAQGLTQSDVASLAGVARRSVYALEHGHAARVRTFERICAALQMDSPEMANSRHLPQVVDDARPFYVHRREDDHWYADAELDTTRMDYQAAIQKPEERNRLGRNGMVPSFSHVLSFVMPRGPGLIFFEIYGRQEIEIVVHLYRDWVVHCLRGAVLATLGGQETELREGDVMGSLNWKDFAAQPLAKIEAGELPPLLLAIGSNRVGKVSGEGGAR